ncbi:hypothetical protein ACFSE0_10500 [Ochrobactrum teleogrylli]|uniref:DUF4376 domain-containing protein n=1 Tax=Ochrobactrum teleogrylli TaxID=2479765 RepID=A0ABY2Y948_9HYPH|nr:hypothetical protein [[Ochrobactrum] teleogrylli]TNV17726.1 hypothetical protein FIC94_06000 [[Ochrobactrum] teleogrylli]
MFAIIKDDLVIGTMMGTVDGITIPPQLIDVQIDRLRFHNGELIDASECRDWYIDELGQKHIVAGERWQAIQCGIDDRLVRSGADGWQMDALTAIKDALKRQVDAGAEAERLKYITPGAGQAMTYQQKVTEAQAFKAASNPQASDYPILSSEVGITAETLSEVADVVLTAFAQWQQIGAMIESIRLGAKRDIDAAEDEAEARAIVDAIIWPSAQVQI